MAKKQSFQEKRRTNRENDPIAKQFTAARAVSVRFALDLFQYFHSLPSVVNIDTNLDNGSTPFFDITNDVPNWFGNTICFDYKAYSFRLYFAFQFNPDLPTVNDRIIAGGLKSGWPNDIEPTRLYKYLSNFWIQLNVSKTHDPHDGANSTFMVRFDASPDWKDVDIFPLHRVSSEI